MSLSLRNALFRMTAVDNRFNSTPPSNARMSTLLIGIMAQPLLLVICDARRGFMQGSKDQIEAVPSTWLMRHRHRIRSRSLVFVSASCIKELESGPEGGKWLAQWMQFMHKQDSYKYKDMLLASSIISNRAHRL